MTVALVTGAAGFIGSTLVARMAEEAIAVRAVDAFTGYGGAERKHEAAARLTTDAGVGVACVDLAEDDLAPLLDGVDVIFHLAGQPGVRASWGTGFGDYARNNVVGTQRLLDASTHADVDRVVYASSSSVYGNALTHPTGEDVAPEPVSPYGVTKLSGELVCGAYAARGGPSVVALRYFTVYGPGQRPDMALHRLFEASLGGPTFPRFGDGTQIRDLTYVDDVVAATLAAGRVSAAGMTTVNVAGGTQVTLNELIARVGEVAGRPVPVEEHPIATGDVRRTSGAVERAADLLDWSAEVALEDGLRAQWAWHREAGPVTNRRTVLITGGAGFIGANLVRRFDADPSVGAVRVLDDLSTGDAANLEGTRAELIEASVTDIDAVSDAARDVDGIVHLGARPSVPRSLDEPVPAHAVNATGTVHVLEAARAAGPAPVPVVVASSSSVYGGNPTLPKHEELAPSPLSPYAASKLAAESYALAWSASFAVPVLALRFFNVYGPLQAADHDYAAVVPRFVDAALAGRPVTVHGEGTQTRDFTYVDTVTAVLARAVLAPISADRPVNLAFGTRTDLLTVLALIEDILGAPVAREHVASRPADVAHSQADGGRVRELFPDVEPTDLRAGLAATIEWMRSTRRPTPPQGARE